MTREEFIKLRIGALEARIESIKKHNAAVVEPYTRPTISGAEAQKPTLMPISIEDKAELQYWRGNDESIEKCNPKYLGTHRERENIGKPPPKIGGKP